MIKQTHKDILKFLISGGICFLIEYLLMIFLVEIFKFNYLFSSTFAFLLSTVINYIFCVRWVFNVKSEIKNKDKIAFYVTSIIALFLNQLLMYIGVSIFIINYKIMKIIATFIVTIINYLFKSYILKKEVVN